MSHQFEDYREISNVRDKLEETETITHEEFMKEMDEYVPAKPQVICKGNPRGWPAFVSD